MPEKKKAPDPIGEAVGASRAVRMTPTDVAFMLAIAARVPVVYLAARPLLDAGLFDSSEARFALFWRAASAAADAAGGKLPADPDAAREIVAVRAEREAASDPLGHYYTPSVVDAVLGEGNLLDVAFGLKITEESEAEGLSLLDKFLTERRLADPLRRALVNLDHNETLDDPCAVLAAMEEHARNIAGIGVDPGSAAVVDDEEFRPAGANVVTTGVQALDLLMGGGHASQEAYAILGPTKAGKSALLTQICVEGAELQNALAAMSGPDAAGHWYYFTWELNRAQLQERVYAYGAKIDRETINSRRPFTTSADLTTLHPYEYDPAVNAPGNPVKGERERIADLRRRLSGPNQRLWLVDFSGQVEGHGGGGVQEVVSYLRREQARGRRPVGVVIDYAGLTVDRYIASTPGLKPSDTYHLLAGFVGQVRSRVSVPFNCTAWVAHQLNGAANRRAPGVRMHHSEAKGCQSFADNADFGLQLSTRNQATGLMTIGCTASRRAPGRDDPIVVHFDGRFGAFACPTQDYGIDPQTHQIVPRDYLDTLPVGPQPGRQPKAINPLAGM